ncbi:nuclear transport factor 2 family protein [Flagellimonas nanhaiensis]|uniref:Nuclear transport factor 2 family protein n=1 Tax=Flagellimonas nanhaiensis TaxID=2292706 RepID=A0A371JR04_9FLAO|nr:nuclear transport factor 2 family protein [Allomuricauda nanhaiensis]RDY59951.1 hypothetical protein DX873_11420 [Allomuricauda nanhaiensis]
MKKAYLSIAFAFFTFLSFAQTEVEAIGKTIETYLNGSSYSDMEQIQEAFYEEAPLYLSKKDQELWVLTPKEYAELFKNRKSGEHNGRFGKILNIDISNNIAMAKAEIRIPARDMVFIDLFLLKKLSGEWKIISKVATLLPNEKS